jgi:hypothetical protein
MCLLYNYLALLDWAGHIQVYWSIRPIQNTGRLIIYY